MSEDSQTQGSSILMPHVILGTAETFKPIPTGSGVISLRLALRDAMSNRRETFCDTHCHLFASVVKNTIRTSGILAALAWDSSPLLPSSEGAKLSRSRIDDRWNGACLDNSPDLEYIHTTAIPPLLGGLWRYANRTVI